MHRKTIDLQALFAIQRLQQALPLMLEKTTPENQDKVQAQWNLMTQIPTGLFALVDYVNFKGEGIKETERYQNQRL